MTSKSHDKNTRIEEIMSKRWGNSECWL